MIEIYGVKIPEEPDNVIFNNLLSYLPDSKRARIQKCIKREDAYRVLIGDILSRILICKRICINNHEISISYNSYKKPIVSNHDSIHFNISHSGEWVVCAADYNPLGIDIQEIRSVKLDIAKRFFSKKEYNSLIEKSYNERLSYFYDLWTLKESYIKAIGKGFYIPLNSFSMAINDCNEISIESNNSYKFFLKQYDISKGYKLSVCCTHQLFPQNIIVKSLGDVYRNFYSFAL